MVDVFISYSSKDAELAELLVKQLLKRGYAVWWDTDMTGGVDFESEIDEALKLTKAAVILWTENALQSQWVKAEALAAAERGIAVPVLLDGVDLAQLPFRQRAINVVDMHGWHGKLAHAGFGQLMRTLEHMVPQKHGEPLSDDAAEDIVAEKSRITQQVFDFFETAKTNTLGQTQDLLKLVREAKLPPYAVATLTNIVNFRLPDLEPPKPKPPPKPPGKELVLVPPRVPTLIVVLSVAAVLLGLLVSCSH